MEVTGSQIHVGEVTCGRSPHLSCKYDQIKMRGYMDLRVTSPTFFFSVFYWLGMFITKLYLQGIYTH